MRRILLTLALAFVATSASAADLFKADSTKDPIPTAATWTGFYVGAHIGGGLNDLDSSLALSAGRLNAGINHTNVGDGILGGGQLGYNYQNGALVFGVEADIGVLGWNKTSDVLTASFGSNSLALGTKFDGGFSADITGRLGYASGPALFYIKGGWAYADITVGIDAPTPYNVSASGFDGWTLGGGLEYLINANWSVKAEYQYFNFGSVTLHPIPSLGINSDLSVDTVKVALSYHWR